MGKGKFTSVLRALGFAALLLAALFAVSRALERKASRQKFGPFLRTAKDYDVLFVGDSHIVNGILPLALYRDWGIASYNLGCIGNTLPVTYWSLVNALDYATPKLVVIGVKDVRKDYKLSGSSGWVHTALDAYPLSLSKFRAIQDLMDDPSAVDDNGRKYADLRGEYLLPLMTYHDRWRDFSPDDLTVQENAMLGAEFAVGVAAPREYTITDDVAEESGWGYVYLRRILDLCRERGIEALLTHLPYPAGEEPQRAANLAAVIGEEYGARMVDFVNLDQVVDYHTDSYDGWSHLNPAGAEKVTDYLGRYMRAHYDLPDRRQDAAAAARWTALLAAGRAYKAQRLGYANTLEETMTLLHDPDFSLALMIPAGSPYYDDDTLLLQTHNLVREHVYEEDAYALWSDGLFPLEGLDLSMMEAAPYCLIADRARGSFTELRGAGKQWTLHTGFGAVTYEAREDGAQRIEIAGRTPIRVVPPKNVAAYLLVFDAATGEQVETRAF